MKTEDNNIQTVGSVVSRAKNMIEKSDRNGKVVWGKILEDLEFLRY